MHVERLAQELAAHLVLTRPLVCVDLEATGIWPGHDRIVQIAAARCCQYLNNVVEQDHRRVKGRLQPMLGLKTFYNARRVVAGIELAQKIQKDQFAISIRWQSNPAVVWRQVMAA